MKFCHMQLDIEILNVTCKEESRQAPPAKGVGVEVLGGYGSSARRFTAWWTNHATLKIGTRHFCKMLELNITRVSAQQMRRVLALSNEILPQ